MCYANSHLWFIAYYGSLSAVVYSAKQLNHGLEEVASQATKLNNTVQASTLLHAGGSELEYTENLAS